jgi:uncharacterized protein (UPF0303 family)
MTRAVPHYRADDLEYLNALELPSMTNDDAVDLGLVAVQVVREWGLNLAVDIVVSGDLVFRAKLRSTGPDNDPWLTGKAATALRFEQPSLLVKLRHDEAGTPFTDRNDIDRDAFKAHGGSIPLRVGGVVVGTITMSGEPDAIDHEAAAETLARYLSR